MYLFLRVFHELDISLGAWKSLEDKIEVTVLHSLIFVLQKEKHLMIAEGKTFHVTGTSRVNQQS